MKNSIEASAMDSPELTAIAERALDFIDNGNVVGLGSGRATSHFVNALGARVRAGLRVKGVPTSVATADLATRMGIPLTSLDQVRSIDVAVDGADEVDPNLDLIKGYGGALVREKIVAAASKHLIILVGPEKLVPVLGARGVLPVEVVPFGLAFCRRRLLDLGHKPFPRKKAGQLFQSDNGNHILDCKVSTITNPPDLEQSIVAIPGVVGSGFFLGMAQTVIVQTEDRVKVLERGRS
jgi:ribose 5-phosphate isomerase A